MLEQNESVFELKPTTAMRKILDLKTRVWGLQGSAGAGKTIAVLWLICDYAWRTPNKKIFIIQAEWEKMVDSVIYDFVEVMKWLGMYNEKRFTRQKRYKFPNGTFIRFIGMDKDDIGKGLRSDLMYFNEANKIASFEAYRQMQQRCKQVVLDFNPDIEFWYHTHVQGSSECSHLVLTYEDNEYCPQNEIDELLSYKARGFDEKGNVINDFWANKWLVYGQGKIGSTEGRIMFWEPCDYRDFLEIPGEIYYGIDWGMEDPFAVIAVKYYDGGLFVHEVNYESENKIKRRLTPAEREQLLQEEEGLIMYLWRKWGIPKEADQIADNTRRRAIDLLRKLGYRIAATRHKYPGSVLERVTFMAGLKVYYTSVSENIRFEVNNYAMKKDRHGTPLDKPEDAHNHAMDAIGYIVMHMAEKGVIHRV